MRISLWPAIAVVTALSACGGDSDSTPPAAAPLPPAPAAPENVTVTGPADSTSVSWDRVSGADHYNVYFSTDPAQEIGSYAAYENAGLQQPAGTSTTIDLGSIDVPVYLRVTAENAGGESTPALAVAILSMKPDASDSSVWNDSVTGLQWDRCNLGQSWTGSSCTGAETVLTDTQAQNDYGLAPLPSGDRPPTYTEALAIKDCHMPAEGDGQANPFLDDCADWLAELFPAQDSDYPSFFVYDDDNLATLGHVCTMRYLTGTAGCAAKGTRDVRVSLIRTTP